MTLPINKSSLKVRCWQPNCICRQWHLTVRPRLLAQLSQGVKYKITLIFAPRLQEALQTLWQRGMIWRSRTMDDVHTSSLVLPGHLPLLYDP